MITRRKLGARAVLMPIGCAGLIAGLPLYFILIERADIEKPKTMTAAYLALWILVAAAGMKGRRSGLVRRPQVFWCYFAFLALYYVNWGMWPKATALDELMWAYSVASAIVPFMLGSLFQARDLRPFFTAITAWSLGLSATVLLSYLEGGEAASGRFLVADSLNPISQSLVIGYALLIASAYVLAERRLWPIVATSPILFLLALGGSRGPVIALMAGVVAMSLVGRRSWKTLVLAVLLLAAVPFVGIHLPDEIKERYLTTEDVSIGGRVFAAEAAVGRWLEYPIFGSGTSGNGEITYAHNMVLQILMETGALGLLLFLGLSVPIIWTFMKRTATEPPNWERIALLGFLVYALVEAQVSGTIMAFGPLWMALGMALGVGAPAPMESVRGAYGMGRSVGVGAHGSRRPAVSRISAGESV
jgi:O-antigen ligase